MQIAPLTNAILEKPYLNQVKRCNDCLIKIKDIELVLAQKSILVTRK